MHNSQIIIGINILLKLPWYSQLS